MLAATMPKSLSVRAVVVDVIMEELKMVLWSKG